MKHQRDPKEYYCRVVITIHPFQKDEKGEYVTDWQHSHWLKSLDYPRRIIESRKWYVKYLVAKFQVRFPRHIITSHWGYYDPITKEKLQSKRLRSISSAKAQVTKVENGIMRWLEAMKNDLFFDPKTDETLIKLQTKLDVKKQNLLDVSNEAITEIIK